MFSTYVNNALFVTISEKILVSIVGRAFALRLVVRTNRADMAAAAIVPKAQHKEKVRCFFNF